MNPKSVGGLTLWLPLILCAVSVSIWLQVRQQQELRLLNSEIQNLQRQLTDARSVEAQPQRSIEMREEVVPNFQNEKQSAFTSQPGARSPAFLPNEIPGNSVRSSDSDTVLKGLEELTQIHTEMNERLNSTAAELISRFREFRITPEIFREHRDDPPEKFRPVYSAFNDYITQLRLLESIELRRRQEVADLEAKGIFSEGHVEN